MGALFKKKTINTETLAVYSQGAPSVQLWGAYSGCSRRQRISEKKCSGSISVRRRWKTTGFV